MNKRLLINKRLLVVFCVILALILFLFVPFPTHIDAALSGIRIERDVGLNDITMTLKGWRLCYLLHGDKLNATLNIAPFGANLEESLIVPVKGSILGQTSHRVVFDRYIPSQNSYATATLYFAGDFSQMLYCDEGDRESMYVVYSGDSDNAQEIADALASHG